jgi:cytochrome c oxidase subunit 2
VRFGTDQLVVLVVFGVLALLVIAIFVVAAAASRREIPLERVQRRGYAVRKRWLGLLAALVPLLVGIAAVTAPYSRGSGTDRILVDASSAQFFFTFDPPAVPAGSKVRFAVTTKDVTHGFGLYDPRGELIGSVQAMPEYTNNLDLTLTRPGRYRVLCFELCGLGHHAMQGTFTVTER